MIWYWWGKLHLDIYLSQIFQYVSQYLEETFLFIELY